MNKKQKARLLELHKRLEDAPTVPLPSWDECKKFWKDIFDMAPEGDFEWKDGDASDPVPYRCCDGEDGCSGWDSSMTSVDIWRKNGKEYMAVYNGDRDGNWDIDHHFESPEDIDFPYYLKSEHTHEYFRAWAEYWLYCAEYNVDPLDGAYFSWADKVTRKVRDKWAEFCLDAAEQDIKYLEKQ